MANNMFTTYHTYSFDNFSSGDDYPSIETPKGDYPTYITQESGKVVPVVQAYCYSKYVGRFDLYFDADGELKTPVNEVGVQNAKPHLLDKNVKVDEEVQELIDEYKAREEMIQYLSTVGVILSNLTTYIQAQETNLGNVITDSMVEAGGWEDATIGIINNGMIR